MFGKLIKGKPENRNAQMLADVAVLYAMQNGKHGNNGRRVIPISPMTSDLTINHFPNTVSNQHNL